MQIYKNNLKINIIIMNDKLNNILAIEIQNGKNTQNLPIEYIKNKLKKYLLTNGQIYKKLKQHVEKKGLDNIEKNKFFKQIVKEVKSEIGNVYGSFLTQEFHKKSTLLENDVGIFEIMKLHKSTKERIEYYETIYKEIFDWYKPKKIADLACGLNPISYPLIEKELNYKPKYFASDLSKEDMIFINDFFEKENISGVAKSFDITDMSIFEDKDFIDSDLVFLFKALDSFEEVKKNLSKEILEKIPSNHIVVTFPTKSLFSKQEFKIEKRNWLFNFLEKKGWKYDKREVENELIILINK